MSMSINYPIDHKIKSTLIRTVLALFDDVDRILWSNEIRNVD